MIQDLRPLLWSRSESTIFLLNCASFPVGFSPVSSSYAEIYYHRDKIKTPPSKMPRRKKPGDLEKNKNPGEKNKTGK